MASYALQGNELSVTGTLSRRDQDELLTRGQELLDGRRRGQSAGVSGALVRPSHGPGAPDDRGGTPPSQVVLDLRRVSLEDSSFLGMIAELALRAQQSGKTLVVRAAGRPADLMAWAGLHRVVTLELSSTPASAGV